VAISFLFGLAIETAMLITIYLNEAMVKMVEKHGNSRETLNRRYGLYYFGLQRGCVPN
jgi:hypothetical protein